MNLTRQMMLRNYHPQAQAQVAQQAQQPYYPATAVARGACAGSSSLGPAVPPVEEYAGILQAQQVAQANQAQAAARVDLQQIKTQANDVVSRVEKEVDRFKNAPLRSPPLSNLPLILHCTARS
eukprot:s1164_g5.t1